MSKKRVPNLGQKTGGAIAKNGRDPIKGRGFGTELIHPEICRK